MAFRMRWSRTVIVWGVATLALFSLLGRPAMADECSWQCWGPVLPDPCRNTLYAVAVTPGSAGNDAWAVGAGGTILHWDGAAWHKTTSPTAKILRSVAPARANLALAVGHEGVAVKWNGTAWSSQTTKTTNWFRAVSLVPGSSTAWAAADMAGVCLFLYWNGSAWESKIAGKVHFFGGSVDGISMVNANAGWAVGSAFSSAISSYAGTALRWDGSNWATLPLSTTAELSAVDMLSTTDGWAVGEEGTLLHWDGAAWTARGGNPTSEDLRAVDMLSATQGWAVGAAGVILHWDGSAWTAVASPVTQDLLGVAIASADNAWAVGNSGVILRWDGTRWNKLVGPEIGRLEDLSITPGSAGYDAWAVGSSRMMLHWNGREWRPVQGPPAPNGASSYYAVDMLSPRDGWAGGIAGQFSRWDGQSWAAAGRFQSVLDIEMLGPDDGWAVGWSRIMHWDGGTWTQVTSPEAGASYYGLDAVSRRDIWAVDGRGVIVHYDGSQWTKVASPVTEWLTDVSMASASDGWIVGNYGVLLHWNGSNWTKAAGDLTYTTLRGVSVLGGGAGVSGWAVGHNGTILRLAGGAWATHCSPTANDLWAVQMASRYEAWAVGDSGVLLHWKDPSPPRLTARVRLPLVRR